jgi:hypothetical protein
MCGYGESDGSASVTGPSRKGAGGHSIRKARAALAEARQRAKEAPPVEEDVKVFVTRIPGGPLYGWEIRQFGGVVLERGQGSFATSAEAQTDGARALAGRFLGTSNERTS